MPNQVWIRLVLPACLTACLVVPHETIAQVSQPRLFGVMGQVARPGLYELSSQFPSLVKLVESAGGLTNRASGSIRIVRDGRASLHTFYTATVPIQLIPGDLVVVDASDAIPIQVRGSINAERVQASAVQLAFVNLLSHPIVVKVRMREATLERIIESLGQPREIASTVRVIRTHPDRFNLSQSSQPALLPRSVLVFDPVVIDYSNIPQFPEPYKEDDGKSSSPAPVASPSRVASPSNPDPIPRESESVAPEVTRDWVAGPIEPVPSMPVPSKLATETESAPNPAAPMLVDSFPMPGQNDGPTVEDETKDNTNTPGPADDLTVEPQLDPEAATPALGSTPETHAEPVLRIDLSAVETAAHESNPPVQAQLKKAELAAAGITAQQPTQSQPGTYRLPQNKMLIASISLSLVAAMAFAAITLWSIVGHKTQPEVASKPIPPSNRYFLDAIINNRLPLVEEPLSLPSSLQFHGRPAEQKSYRLETKPPKSHPHFEKRTLDSESTVSSTDSNSRSLPSGRSLGLLERALTSVHGGDL